MVIFLRILFMKGKFRGNMRKLKKGIKIFLIILSILIIIVVINIKDKLDKEKYQDIETIDDIKIVNNDEIDNSKVSCMVDIKGAVKNPGVYTTKCSDNVSDIIRLAGGLTDNADTSVTNLAKKITNEMVIIIYTKEEVKNSNIVDTVIKVVEGECVCPNIQNDGCINEEITDTISNGNKLININTASIDELKKIPGIGESKAKSIIEYRNNKGNFKTIQDIQNVTGIGSKLYEEIKAYITT